MSITGIPFFVRIFFGPFVIIMKINIRVSRESSPVGEEYLTQIVGILCNFVLHLLTKCHSLRKTCWQNPMMWTSLGIPVFTSKQNWSIKYILSWRISLSMQVARLRPKTLDNVHYYHVLQRRSSLTKNDNFVY